MEQTPIFLQVFFWSAVAYWVSGFLLLWRIPVLSSPVPGTGNSSGLCTPEEPLGRLSVIIPARNEAENIARLLESLRDQDCPPLEIIVADDHSDDGTAGIARGYADIGVRVIPSGERPGGWTGKNWACHQGAIAAKGDHFLFLDADTQLSSSDALRRITAEADRLGGMISVQPLHLVRRLYEQLSAFFNLVVMIGSGAFSRWSRTGEAFSCFGPCMFLGREDYFTIGGHEAVRREVVDDLALCRLCRRAGIGVHCFGGKGTIAFRMYPGGVGSLVEGWTKNIAVGASLTDTRTVVLLVVWFTGISNAALLLVFLPYGSAGVFLIGISLCVYVLYVLQVYIQLRRVGTFAFIAALFFPLLFLFFVGVFFYSLIRVHIFRSVTWKGRMIHVGKGE